MSIFPRILVLLSASSLLAATPTFAGLNSGAHCRLTWGPNFESQQTNVATPEGKDTQVTLWVSAVGLHNFRGADIQLVVKSAVGSLLPGAWQFQGDDTSCAGNDQNLLGTKSFPGSAFAYVPWVALAQDGMMYGSANLSPTFRGLWVIWFTAAGSQGAPCNPERRYGIAEFKLTLSGTTCPGVSAPVAFTPSLRIGYEIYPYFGQPLVALLDGNDEVDAVPFDPGFSMASANVSSPGTTAGTHVQTWGQLKHLYGGK